MHGAWQLANCGPIGVNQQQGFTCAVPRVPPVLSLKQSVALSLSQNQRQALGLVLQSTMTNDARSRCHSPARVVMLQPKPKPHQHTTRHQQDTATIVLPHEPVATRITSSQGTQTLAHCQLSCQLTSAECSMGGELRSTSSREAHKGLLGLNDRHSLCPTNPLQRGCLAWPHKDGTDEEGIGKTDSPQIAPPRVPCPLHFGCVPKKTERAHDTLQHPTGPKNRCNAISNIWQPLG